jgi:hypothetical protein
MATEEEGLGGLARRWLRAKKTELLAGTRASQQAASTEEGNAWRDLSNRAASDAMYAAFPGLRRMRDKQDAAKAQQAADAREEVLALPRFRVEVGVTGDVSGSASGDMPVRVEVSDGDPEENEPPSLTLSVETTEDGEGALPLGGQPLLGLRLVVRPFTGPGSYDLSAAGDDADPLDYVFELGNRDEPFYWSPDIGAGSVTVGDGTFDVRMTMSGASGEIQLTARLTAQ